MNEQLHPGPETLRQPDTLRVFQELGDRLFSYLSLQCGSHHDAEDLIQDLFLQLNQACSREAGLVVNDVEGYLFGAARNLVVDYRRRLGSAAKLKANMKAQALLQSRPVASGQDAADDCRRLQAALLQLPDEQREIIVLKLYCGMTLKTAAQVCGIPEGTAASRYRYALAALQTKLREFPA